MDPRRPASPDDARASFAAWLAAWRSSLQQPWSERASAPPPRRATLQRQLLLSLEQMWKIETQLVFPALDAARAPSPLSQQALREVEWLRDLALLVERCPASESDVVSAVMRGLAELHFARVDALLQSAGVAGVDWPALLDEATAWLAQWRDEVHDHGDIEDEDRDPVGLPPR